MKCQILFSGKIRKIFLYAAFECYVTTRNVIKVRNVIKYYINNAKCLNCLTASPVIVPVNLPVQRIRDATNN